MSPPPGAAPRPPAGTAPAGFGATLLADGRTRFRLWAPSHRAVRLVLGGGAPAGAAERVVPMAATDGWHEAVVAGAAAGTRYWYELGEAGRVPDPASRFQPEGVHGPSEVVDPGSYRWSDAAWRGRPWHETVLYELHVGTFTPAGTFRGVLERLDALVDLGVTAIELMPVAAFAGRRGWGYDGAFLFAPHADYGRPEDLKALVDAAHARALAVFLDVVWNHLGPEGSSLAVCSPEVRTDRHRTPWGPAIDFDGPTSGPVRALVLENALQWLDEYHFDGLRVDAVHAIVDESPRHVLDELADRVHAGVGRRRHVHLVLENERNQARFLGRDAVGRPRLATAQWNDDFHHCLHVATTGERHGYYRDYDEAPARLGRVLAEGFAYQGEPSPHQGGAPRGDASGHLPPTAFVSCLQNHDQVGNRALGERIGALAPPAPLRAVACLYLLAPQVPMLFMGEEWAAAQPFQFFCDFGPELADAVRAGRRAEFGGFHGIAPEDVPDPQDEATFRASILAWEDRDRAPHAAWLAWYRGVLRARREHVVPLLRRMTGAAGRYEVLDGRGLHVGWRIGDGRWLRVVANTSPEPLPVTPVCGEIVWSENGEPPRAGAECGEGARVALAPWQVVWWIEEPAALERLADRAGLEPEYVSSTGERVRTSGDTARALLGAMGIDAEDDPIAAASYAALRRADLERPLAPVVVAREDDVSFAAPVTVPAGVERVCWRLVLEDGTETFGEARVADLELVATDVLGERRYETRVLDLAGERVPLGYHALSVELAGTDLAATACAVAAPARCWLAPALERGERVWGLAAQLYAVRGERDRGLGDFTTLAELVRFAADHGADVVGLNPLHAVFPDLPEHASPYSPASRLFANVLYVDPTAVPEAGCGAAASADVPAVPPEAHGNGWVDYRAVAAARWPALEALHAAFRRAAPPARRAAFEAFRRAGGAALERFATHQALRAHFAAQPAIGADWHAWPEEYRDAASPAVAAFAAAHAERVAFHAWLQWIADEQLGAAAALARTAGLAIGLYRDLAVGADPAGAETWSAPRLAVSGAHVGAPPDLFNPAGQDWGLPPFAPERLREEAYRPFVAVLRANMRHAGAVRIDHVMALQQLFWIPAGRPPRAGAYVRYPLADLVGILALESVRHRCVVVGEDLGTVPAGFRDRMARARVLSYRTLFFEWRADGSFVPAGDYPRLALATVGSHDLATLRGWWEGRDVELKERHGLYPAAGEVVRQRERRAWDRRALLAALAAEGLELPPGTDACSPWSAALGVAVHAFLARTPCLLRIVQLDDLAGETEQVNLPGTVDAYPNWRRRIGRSLAALAHDPNARATLAAVAGRPVPRDPGAG